MVEKRILKGLCALFVLMASTYSYGMRDAEVGSRRAAQKRHFYGIDAAGLGGGALDSGEFARDIAKRARFEESYGVDIDEKEAADQDAQFEAQSLENLGSSITSAKQAPEPDTELTCKQCGQGFSSKGNLRRHMITHTGEKLFRCEECGKNFTAKGNLERHMITHTGVQPFACKACDKRFARNENLIEHVRAHEGERPFACKACDKRFVNRSNLFQHSQTHNAVGQACSQCGKGFANKSNLKRHMKTHNAGNNAPARNKSDMSSTQASALLSHMRKPFACKACGKRFSKQSNLELHGETHWEYRHELIYASDELMDKEDGGEFVAIDNNAYQQPADFNEAQLESAEDLPAMQWHTLPALTQEPAQQGHVLEPASRGTIEPQYTCLDCGGRMTKVVAFYQCDRCESEKKALAAAKAQT